MSVALYGKNMHTGRLSCLFLGGRAGMQFLYVAMNLLENKAGCLKQVWAKKALRQGIGNAVAVASSADKNF